MNKTKIAQISTATAILFAGAGLAWKIRQDVSAVNVSDPQSAIYATFDAARAGNTQLYLSHFSSSMEATLRQTMGEVSEGGFSAYLKNSNASLKGIAVSEPARVDDREVKARVESVRSDQTVAQMWYLAKEGGVWKVSRIEDEQTMKMPFAYGTRIR